MNNFQEDLKPPLHKESEQIEQLAVRHGSLSKLPWWLRLLICLQKRRQQNEMSQLINVQMEILNDKHPEPPGE